MSGDKLNQFITTPVMEDGGFSTQDTKETIAGYDYKEVVNQSNRDWIKNNYKNVGNYFAKIMFKDSKSLLEKLKNKSILQRESTIKEYDSGSEAFEYNHNNKITKNININNNTNPKKDNNYGKSGVNNYSNNKLRRKIEKRRNSNE